MLFIIVYMKKSVIFVYQVIQLSINTKQNNKCKLHFSSHKTVVRSSLLR